MDHEETIFERALGISSEEERQEFLREACAANKAMFERLQGLLRAHDRAGKFLEHEPMIEGGQLAPVAAASGGSTLTLNLPLTEKPGDRIGRYKLLQKIGEGGCGVVYMAEQDEPVRRRVALKIIKLGMDTRQVIARFEAERQALALMDHPNIAKVLDAGATETGRPFFVMELVRGIKITEYCDEKKLSTEQRLELFMQVCRAVQHAHQKGIIHRDLKPSNIIVSFNDGIEIPKVIDFGIAKATSGEPLTDKTVFTAFEQFIGTPAYMSPEQALVSSLDVDTRTDIYALGVLLYELLTGRTPFDPKELLQGGIDAMRRTICEKEPERPSTRLSTMAGEELNTTAQRRGLDAPKLLSQLRGDLDWIVMKCLEKDRARRYETANGLGADIQRHLNNEPILARPPTTAYRLKKFVRRNKLTFATAAAVSMMLVLGTFVSTWQAMIATQARRDAMAAAKQAQLSQSAEAEQRRNAVQARDEARSQEIRARRNAYAAKIALAYEALQRGHLGRARELQQKAADAAQIAELSSGNKLDTKDLRGWEWRYLWAQTRGDDLFIVGRHEPMAQVVAWMPDGVRAVSSGKDGKVKFWHVEERRLLQQLDFPNRANGLALSPDGARLVIGLEDGRVSFVDTASTQTIWQIRLPHRIGQVAYSPDEELIAVAGDYKVSLLSTKDGAIQRSLNSADTGSWKSGLAFSPDSGSLVFRAPAEGAELRVLDVQNGTEQQLGTPAGARVVTLAFSPDGLRLVCGDQAGRITIWDWKTRRIERVLRSHHAQVICVTFSRDGTKMASTGADQSIKLWDTRTFGETCSLRGHEFEVWSVAFSPDGKRLISAAKDDTIRIWPAELPPKQTSLSLPGAFDTSQDGTNSTLLVIDGNPGGFILGHLFTGEVIMRGALDPRLLRQSACRKLVFNDHIAFGFSDGHVELCDLRSRSRLWAVTNHDHGVTRIAGTDRIGGIAAAYSDGRIDLLQRKTGEVMRSFQTGPLPIGGGNAHPILGFSRDGRRLFAGTFAGTELSVWNLETGQEKRLQLKQREGLLNATISDDGEWVVTTSYDAFASLWEVDSGHELARFTGQFIGFFDAAISPDKTRVALMSNGVGMDGGHLSLWSTANEQQLVDFAAEEGFGSLVGWDATSDNMLTFAGSRLRMWHAPSWAEIEAPQDGIPVQTETWKVATDAWYRKAAESGSAIALNNLAWVLATSGNSTERDGTSAVHFAEQAVEKSDRKEPMYLDTLAAAWAEAGDFSKALTFQKEAIALLRTEDAKKDYISRLKLYEANTPCRE